MRTIVDIPQPILDEIDALAEREAISRAEAVRRAVSEYVARHSRPRPDAGFGIWKSRNIDPLAYEDALREEWNR